MRVIACSSHLYKKAATLTAAHTATRTETPTATPTATHTAKYCNTLLQPEAAICIIEYMEKSPEKQMLLDLRNSEKRTALHFTVHI